MLFVEIALGLGNVVDERVNAGRVRATAGREKRESAELDAPKSDRFVRNRDASLSE